jgi:uncharacterized protein YggT (Ycf19 family)
METLSLLLCYLTVLLPTTWFILTILVLIVFLVELVPPAYRDVAKVFLDCFEPIRDDLPPCKV